MPRVSVYDIPHKGLRNAFAQFSMLTCNADYSNSAHVQKVIELGNTVIAMLKTHAHSENDLFISELETKDPAIVKYVLSEHERIENSQHFVELRLTELHENMTAGNDVTALGRLLYTDWNAFHAAYFSHMVDEETNIQAVIWKHFTDEQLIEQSKRAQSKIPPQEMAMFLKFILPAQNRMERIMLLKGIQAGAPAPVFEQIKGIARASLSPQEFDELGI